MLTTTSDDTLNQRFTYHSTAATDRELLSDMALLWEQLFIRTRDTRKDGSWNRIIFDFYCYDGLLIAYPQKRGESPDKRLPELVVSLDILKDTIIKLHESDNDAEMENLINLAYIRVRGAIIRSYSTEPALTQLKKTLESNDFTAWTMKDGDVEALYEFEIVFD
jgi:hypothetical protein